MMRDYFYTYFYSFLHPFKFHAFLRQEREKQGPEGEIQNILPLFVEETPPDQETAQKLCPMDTAEIICVTWLFHLVYAIYSIAAIGLGFYAWSYFNDSEDSIFDLAEQFHIQQHSLILTTLMFAVFIPAFDWLALQIWRWIIKLFAGLYDLREKLGERMEESIKEVANYSLCSNAFLLIPVFGKMLQRLGQVFFLFAGLKKNMGMTIAQSFVVSLTVYLALYILIFLLLLMIVLYVWILVGFF
jgi:hypothetical protein